MHPLPALHTAHMARFIIALGAGLLLTIPASLQGAYAQAPASLIDGGDIIGVLNTARQFGSAAVSRQTNGDPLIAGSIQGYPYTLRFLNCPDRLTCEDLNFRVGFQIQVTPERINEWNAGKRFSRAYLDSDGDVILVMDVTLKGGVSPDNLSSNFNNWRLSLTQFVEHIGFN